MKDDRDIKTGGGIVPDGDALDRARQLVRMLIDYEVSPGLHDKLRGWFESGPENSHVEQAFVELAVSEMVESTELTPEEREKFLRLCEKLNIPIAENKAKGAKKPLRRRLSVRIAAVLIPALAVLGAGYLTGWFGPDDQPQVRMLTAGTIDGVQKDIGLSDNTLVWINSSSSITYPEEFAGKERRVRLEGEAFFDVAEDTKKPFVVCTEKIRVKVLGTKFNIVERIGEGISEVVLQSGLVKVTAGDNRSIKLQPGQMLTYRHATEEITVEKSSRYRDWRSDVIETENRTLPELLRMVANYYDRQVVFDEAGLNAASLFSIQFGKENSAEQVIAALARLTGEFEYNVDNDTIYIKDKKLKR